MAYTVMTVSGIGTGLFVGYFVIDRLQRKSLCVALATACSGAASGLLYECTSNIIII
jgi:hypothetical protein